MRATGARARAAETVGRYELRGVLGRGGFATVYRAWDPLLGREVALKALLPHLADDADLRRRFVAEARALARLRHPAIAVVYDVGEAGGCPFFAMELIEGETLAARVAGGRPLSLAEAVAVVGPLAGAIDYLHDAGLLHRDIKASNVMIARTGRVVLMDLGIARARDAESTRGAALLGTPAAMAPEQVRGERVGPAADIYSLGVLIFTLLAGQPPFTGEVARVLHAHAYDPPPSLRALRPGLPPSAYQAAEAALAKRPEHRPRLAAELAAALAGEASPESETASVTRRLAPPPIRLTTATTVDRSSARTARRGSRPTPSPAGRTWTLPRPGRRAVLIGGGALAALLLGALALRDGGDQGGALGGMPGRPALTARAPQVSGLQVFDSVFTRRGGEFRAGESVAACFALKPGGDGRPLAAVVTRAEQTPAAADDPAVLARSEPVPNKADATCHALRVLAPPLPPGPYRVSVLHGGETLAAEPFTALPGPGDVLLAETFDDPARGALPPTSPDPGRFTLAYVDGGYQIAKADPGFSGVPFVSLPGRYADASLAVDARVQGDPTDRYVALGCRAATAALDSGYRVSLNLGRGTFLLDRWDGGVATSLAQGTTPAIRRDGRANRIELSCAGDTIAVSVNGTRIASAQDAAHRDGLFWIGIESDPARHHAIDARFDNLTVTQQ